MDSILLQYDVYSWQIVLLLLLAGFLVGIINTLAGSGTIISYSFFMFLGLPASYANGTIRLGVIMQTLAASLNFRRQKVLNFRKGISLGIPTLLGSAIGAFVAISIDKDIFEIIVGFVMLLMLFFVFFDPKRWIEGKNEKIIKKPGIIQVLVFFAIGLYGGFIHIGVGIFLLSALVLVSGYDLVRANAMKVFIVLIYSPVALAVFMYSGNIHYGMGLIAAVGNVFGGLLASHFAVSWGAKFLRWFLIVVIVLFSLKLFGIIKL
ncbi:MAG: hypothetical protein C0594_08930 [Marinilabiliales bacterium]|nr:MAG: hypothetical protein C0594_08930 [Marinilabiliales bacterium]